MQANRISAQFMEIMICSANMKWEKQAWNQTKWIYSYGD